MMQYYGRILGEAKDVPVDDAMWTVERPSDIRRSGFGRAVMIGTPDQVAEKLARFVKSIAEQDADVRAFMAERRRSASSGA